MQQVHGTMVKSNDKDAKACVGKGISLLDLRENSGEIEWIRLIKI